MRLRKSKPKSTAQGAPITDHGTYWSRQTAKPQSLPPIPSPGQLGQ